MARRCGCTDTCGCVVAGSAADETHVAVTVTGTGVAATPYVIRAARTVVTQGAGVTVTGSGTSADPFVVTAVDDGDDAALAAHIGDAIDAHDASSVSFVPAGTIAANQVQAAIEEVSSEAAADLAAHLADATDAHDASAISFVPAGTIAATQVQAALEEVALEAASTYEVLNTVAATGAAEAVPDPNTASVSHLTLDANCTLTFPALPGAGVSKSFTVVLKQDAVGGRTVVWPGTVVWAAGAAPVLTATANKRDIFTFLCADGTTWLGFVAGQNFA